VRRSCDNCRFVRGRQPFAEIPQGWCHRYPPLLHDDGTSSSYPPVALAGGCGEHRWSIAGIFRLFFRESAS